MCNIWKLAQNLATNGTQERTPDDVPPAVLWLIKRVKGIDIVVYYPFLSRFRQSKPINPIELI